MILGIQSGVLTNIIVTMEQTQAGTQRKCLIGIIMTQIGSLTALKDQQRFKKRKEKGRFKLSNKYKYLINSPFPISHKCCEVMKKKPIKKYEKLTGKVPFIGTLAEESALRTQSYLKTGCNSFNSKRPNSTPLGFWTEQDILEYIYKYKLPINKAYGEVIFENNQYRTTKCSRTGCIACGFGVHLEKNPNRFERMKEEYPKQYDYYFNKLGYKEICDYIGIKY